MKDLDFDELDRAVNSVIRGKSAPAPKSAEVVETETVPTPDVFTPEVSVVPVTIRTLPPVQSPAFEAPTVPAAVVTQPLAARRSSGRFMDVVHPSSDMRTGAATPAPVSRKGIDIAPINTDTRDITADPAPSTELEPFSWSEESRSLADAENSADVASEWPDPLDMPDFSYSSPENDVTNAQPVAGIDPPALAHVDDDDDINQIANASTAVIDSTPAPQESPFLSDAKIQKRPLGAFTLDANSINGDSEVDATVEPDTEVLSRFSEPTRFVSAQASENHDAQLSGATDGALPAELQDEVLLLEANLENNDQPVRAELTESKDAGGQNFSGATSISQQYDEQPSTGDQQSGAIYDTEAYHKPLTHPTQKKSGWMMIVWILLLLVVGAGAGAAVYFFVLPLL